MRAVLLAFLVMLLAGTLRRLRGKNEPSALDRKRAWATPVIAMG